jgi:hypothetical protein
MIQAEQRSTSRLNLAFLSMPLKQGLFEGPFLSEAVTSVISSQIWIKMGLIEESQTLRPLPQVRENSAQISRDKPRRYGNPTAAWNLAVRPLFHLVLSNDSLHFVTCAQPVVTELDQRNRQNSFFQSPFYSVK